MLFVFRIDLGVCYKLFHPVIGLVDLFIYRGMIFSISGMLIIMRQVMYAHFGRSLKRKPNCFRHLLLGDLDSLLEAVVAQLHRHFLPFLCPGKVAILNESIYQNQH